MTGPGRQSNDRGSFSFVSISEVSNLGLAAVVPEPNGLSFSGGTHMNSATVTYGEVVQDNTSFTTFGAVSSNPAAEARGLVGSELTIDTSHP